MRGQGVDPPDDGKASVCSQNPKCLALAATPPHTSYWKVRMQIDDSNKPFRFSGHGDSRCAEPAAFFCQF